MAELRPAWPCKCLTCGLWSALLLQVPRPLMGLLTGLPLLSASLQALLICAIGLCPTMPSLQDL